MRKGQISFDFVFAIVMVLMLSQLLTNFYKIVSANEAEMGIRRQERYIGNNIARIAAYYKTFEREVGMIGYPGIYADIRYKVPMIYALGKTEATPSIGCNIQIETANSWVKVTVDSTQYSGLTGTDTIEEIVYIPRITIFGGNIVNSNCGSLLRLTKSD